MHKRVACQQKFQNLVNNLNNNNNNTRNGCNAKRENFESALGLKSGCINSYSNKVQQGRSYTKINNFFTALVRGNANARIQLYHMIYSKNM